MLGHNVGTSLPTRLDVAYNRYGTDILQNVGRTIIRVYNNNNNNIYTEMGGTTISMILSKQEPNLHMSSTTSILRENDPPNVLGLYNIGIVFLGSKRRFHFGYSIE